MCVEIIYIYFLNLKGLNPFRKSVDSGRENGIRFVYTMISSCVILIRVVILTQNKRNSNVNIINVISSALLLNCTRERRF